MLVTNTLSQHTVNRNQGWVLTPQGSASPYIYLSHKAPKLTISQPPQTGTSKYSKTSS